jgi:hypothetical protein
MRQRNHQEQHVKGPIGIKWQPIKIDIAPIDAANFSERAESDTATPDGCAPEGPARNRKEKAMRSYVTKNHMNRYLGRAEEVAVEPGIPAEVKRVYDDVLAPHAAAFRTWHEAVAKGQTAVAKARRRAREELATFDSTYRAARSVVLAFSPDETLPDTLKALGTDTDMLGAITTLSSIVQSYAGEAWADELSAGTFGTRAPKVMEALKDSITASKALLAAQQARAAAHKPAYDKYRAFKRVVGDCLGTSSAQYRRLHIRTRAAKQIEEANAAEEAAPESGVIPSARDGTTMPAGPPSVTKIA